MCLPQCDARDHKEEASQTEQNQARFASLLVRLGDSRALAVPAARGSHVRLKVHSIVLEVHVLLRIGVHGVGGSLEHTVCSQQHGIRRTRSTGSVSHNGQTLSSFWTVGAHTCGQRSGCARSPRNAYPRRTCPRTRARRRRTCCRRCATSGYARRSMGWARRRHGLRSPCCCERQQSQLSEDQSCSTRWGAGRESSIPAKRHTEHQQHYDI